MRSGVYFVQPNVCRVGGPTGMRRIMNLIDLNERVFAPHSWSSIICMTANMHLMATVRKHYMLEYDINPVLSERISFWSISLNRALMKFRIARASVWS